MSGIHALQLSVKLNELERKIKDAEVVKFEKLPTDQDIATRKLIEYAKPARLLEEMVNIEPVGNKHIGSNFDEHLREEILLETPAVPSEKFKESFREVLRLAKSGQQAWWTDELKNSTETHIERLDEYYRQNYCDETTD